jgi:hypothetical protein
VGIHPADRVQIGSGRPAALDLFLREYSLGFSWTKPRIAGPIPGIVCNLRASARSILAEAAIGFISTIIFAQCQLGLVLVRTPPSSTP